MLRNVKDFPNASSGSNSGSIILTDYPFDKWINTNAPFDIVLDTNFTDITMGHYLFSKDKPDNKYWRILNEPRYNYGKCGLTFYQYYLGLTRISNRYQLDLVVTFSAERSIICYNPWSTVADNAGQLIDKWMSIRLDLPYIFRILSGEQQKRICDALSISSISDITKNINYNSGSGYAKLLLIQDTIDLIAIDFERVSTRTYTEFPNRKDSIGFMFTNNTRFPGIFHTEILPMKTLKLKEMSINLQLNWEVEKKTAF